jgi:phenylacetic acid degradation operon negative regulatory protein
MKTTAKSLILELLSTTGRAPVSVRSLLGAARLFDIEDNALRVALARLRSGGLVTSDARGRYRLGPGAVAVNQRTVSWRHIEQRVRPWEGAWVGVHLAGLRGTKTRQRKRHAQALRLLGLRELDAGLFLRPDNLIGGVDGTREQLRSLGLDGRAPVFALSELDAATEAAARGLWDRNELRARYKKICERLRESAQRLPELSVADAMRESYRLGGEGLRAIVLDPLLPEPIGPVAERRELVTVMGEYDALGRNCWAGWLGGDPLPDRGPVDVQGLEGAGSWLADRGYSPAASAEQGG